MNNTEVKRIALDAFLSRIKQIKSIESLIDVLSVINESKAGMTNDYPYQEQGDERSSYQLLIETVLLKAIEITLFFAPKIVTLENFLRQFNDVERVSSSNEKWLANFDIMLCFSFMEAIEKNSDLEIIKKFFLKFKELLTKIKNMKEEDYYVSSADKEKITASYLIYMILRATRIISKNLSKIISNTECFIETLRFLVKLNSCIENKDVDYLLSQKKYFQEDYEEALGEWEAMTPGKDFSPIYIITAMLTQASFFSRLENDHAKGAMGFKIDLSIWSELALRAMRKHGVQLYEQNDHVYSALLSTFWFQKILHKNFQLTDEDVAKAEKEIEDEHKHLSQSYMPWLLLSLVYSVSRKREKLFNAIIKADELCERPELLVYMYSIVGSEGYKKDKLRPKLIKLKENLIKRGKDARQKLLYFLANAFLEWKQPGAIIGLFKGGEFSPDLKENESLFKLYALAKIITKCKFTEEETQLYSQASSMLRLHNFSLEGQEEALEVINRQLANLVNPTFLEIMELLSKVNSYKNNFFFLNSEWRSNYEQGTSFNDNGLLSLIMLYEELLNKVNDLRENTTLLAKEIKIELFKLYCFAQLEDQVISVLELLSEDETYKSYLEKFKENSELSFSDKCKFLINSEVFSPEDIASICKLSESLEAEQQHKLSLVLIEASKQYKKPSTAALTTSAENIEIDNGEIVNLNLCTFYKAPNGGDFYIYLSDFLKGIELFERDYEGRRLYDQNGFVFKAKPTVTDRQFIEQIQQPKFVPPKGHNGIKLLKGEGDVYQIKVRGKARLLGANIPIYTHDGMKNLLFFTEYCHGSKKGTGGVSEKYKRLVDKLKTAPPKQKM